MIINPYRFGQPLLLDTYPNAAVAYSVRKLRTAYSGAALRVRRSSDNAESDIGFVGNDLDTASLLSFVGVNSGFVTTWYDQSLNNRNATQTTAANQPRIVDNGVLELNANSKPGVRFIDTTTGALGYNLIFPTWHTTTDSYIGIFSTYQLNLAGSNPSITENNSGGVTLQHHNQTRNVRIITRRSVLSSGIGGPVNLNQLYLRYDTANRINLQIYLNGSAIPNVNVTDNNSNFILPANYMLGNGNINNITNTYISEFIAYTVDQTSNKTGIETNIKTYYTIP